MRILFIRHAEAVEREKWGGDDLGRPLTPRGCSTAAQMAFFFSRAKNRPEFMLTSEAVRARQTADFFSCAEKAAVTPMLNPGCTPGMFRSLLKKYARKKFIAVVGHEPDFSTIIADLIGDGSSRIKMSKAACAMVEIDAEAGRLLLLISPKALGDKYPMIGKKRDHKFQALEKTAARKRSGP